LNESFETRLSGLAAGAIDRREGDACRSRCIEIYDPTAEDYYGYGCTIVSTGQKIPIAADFTESKQAPEEAAMRVTCDALAVAKPMWIVGDSTYDTLDWYDHLLAAGVVPVAPYNARNTDDPKDVEYRVEDLITEHSEDVQLKVSTLDETYNRRMVLSEPRNQ